MNFFNIENISFSITLNEKLMFLFIFMGLYSNIVSHGGLFEERGLIVNNEL